MVSSPLKNIGQNGNLPKIGVNILKYLKPPPSYVLRIESCNFTSVAVHPLWQAALRHNLLTNHRKWAFPIEVWSNSCYFKGQLSPQQTRTCSNLLIFPKSSHVFLTFWRHDIYEHECLPKLESKNTKPTNDQKHFFWCVGLTDQICPLDIKQPVLVMPKSHLPAAAFVHRPNAPRCKPHQMNGD